MRTIAILLNVLLNAGLYGFAAYVMLTQGEHGYTTWRVCGWISFILIAAHTVYTLVRIILQASRGQRKASFVDFAVLVAIGVGAYYLRGAYVLLLTVTSGSGPL
jgi:cation transport ATPase